MLWVWVVWISAFGLHWAPTGAHDFFRDFNRSGEVDFTKSWKEIGRSDQEHVESRGARNPVGIRTFEGKVGKQDVKCCFFLCAKFNFSVQRHHGPVDQGQPAMLDFASVQQMLQYTSAAQATDDLTPFLSESQKSPPLLLRGPVPASVWLLWRDVCVMIFDFEPMSLIIPSCVKFLCLRTGWIDTNHSNKPAKFRPAKHSFATPAKPNGLSMFFPFAQQDPLRLPDILREFREALVDRNLEQKIQVDIFTT